MQAAVGMAREIKYVRVKKKTKKKEKMEPSSIEELIDSHKKISLLMFHSA
mgnify:CR=1 FL=1